MAILKSVEFQNTGAFATYWRIISWTRDKVKKECTFVMRGYLDEATAKSPDKYHLLEIAPSGTWEEIGITSDDTEDELIKKLYEFVKTKVVVKKSRFVDKEVDVFDKMIKLDGISKEDQIKIWGSEENFQNWRKQDTSTKEIPLHKKAIAKVSEEYDELLFIDYKDI